MSNYKSAARHATARQSVRAAILKHCSEVREYVAGAIVYDVDSEDAANHRKCLFYIEHGTAEWLRARTDRLSSLGIPRRLSFVGQGDFFGVEQHFQGSHEITMAPRRLRALNNVRVHVIRFSPHWDGRAALDLHVEGFSDKEDLHLWEIIAMQASVIATETHMFLERMTRQIEVLNEIQASNVHPTQLLKILCRGTHNTAGCPVPHPAHLDFRLCFFFRPEAGHRRAHL